MSNNTMRIGNVEIVALSDVTGLDAPRRVMFPDIPDEAWTDHAEYLLNDGKDMPLTVTCYLVRSSGKTVLIDTGIGAKDRPFFPNGRLPDALVEAGVRPDEIDIVANTHMHIDHVGWHTTLAGETYVPTFPKSNIVFNKAEWEHFTAPEVANAPGNEHIVDCVLPLRDVADIDLVDGEHNLTDEITLLPSPGHTPAHQCFAIMSDGAAGIVWGDICHHPAQITEGWSPVFDMNPALAQKSREAVLHRIEDGNMRLAAGHFPYPGFGNITRIDGRRYFRAL
jgi:glyoxylase-like metal-dependent hydrolase (beta-lactamase superfamily II)